MWGVVGLAEDYLGGAGAAAQDHDAAGGGGVDAASVKRVVFGGRVGVVGLVGEVGVDEVLDAGC